MIFRRLKSKDAKYMLEWMRDITITRSFRSDFSSMDLNKVESFITTSLTNSTDLHFAVADDNDEYLGTVSLKNIDIINSNAEYAICMRKKSHGTGAALFGTKSVIKYAFETLKLHRIYLNVYEDNLRANSFYRKIGFNYEGCSKASISINGEFKSLNWYAIINEDKHEIN